MADSSDVSTSTPTHVGWIEPADAEVVDRRPVYCCPACGAAVLSPERHETWHQAAFGLGPFAKED